MKTHNNILIVDDNVEFCDNVSRILALKGYAATGVSDGFKALEAVENSDFDLVLMDIKMPLMNGVETFKKLKQIAPQTPVIMITAYAVEDLIGEALRETGARFGSRDALAFPRQDYRASYAEFDCQVDAAARGRCGKAGWRRSPTTDPR